MSFQLGYPRAHSIALLAFVSLRVPLGACGDATSGTGANAGGAPAGAGGGGGEGGAGGQGGSGGSHAVGHIWSLGFGSAEGDFPTSIAVDGDDNVLFGGHSIGAVDFGDGPLAPAGGSDGIVAKWSPEGKFLWASRFGDAAGQQVFGVAADSAGNVVVAGSFSGSIDLGGGPLTSAGGLDIYVAKLDPSGKHLWSKSFNGAGDETAYRLAVSADDHIYLGGQFEGTITFGGGSLTSAGGSDIYVVKLDATGKYVWNKGYGAASGSHSIEALAAAPNGDVVISGVFSEAIDFGGGALMSAGGDDVFVARVDSFGDPVWSKRFGGEGNQSGRAAHVDDGGNVLLTGQFVGSFDFGGDLLVAEEGDTPRTDIFVAKLDAGGSHLWSKRFGDAEAQVGAGIRADSAGNVVLVGSLQGSVDFGGEALTAAVDLGVPDVFVAKFDPAGAHLWSRRYGDKAGQNAAAVAIDSGQNILLTGNNAGTFDFGGDPLNATTSDDSVFVAKLKP
jgi:hypothetical protein